MARGIQHATLVLLFVPWLLIGGTTYWYWSRFGRAVPDAGPETGEAGEGVASPESDSQAGSAVATESRPGPD